MKPDETRGGTPAVSPHGDLPQRATEDSSSLPKAEHYVIRDVINPHGVVRVIRDHWWWCLDSDWSRAVFYIGRGRYANRHVGSPQCNSVRSIVERIPVPFEQAVICRIPMAFVPVERDER